MVLHLTPQNIEFYATFLHSSAHIHERVIYFGSGVADEKLLEVPLCKVDPHATIVITIGLDKSHPSGDKVDSDPKIGLSDGTTNNVFIMPDVHNYREYSPCYPISGSHDDTRVSSDTQVSATFKLTFVPFNQFGYCETAQDGGYINTGTFKSQIDITKPLFLTVRRSNEKEEYYFHYFKVEIF